MSYNPLLFKAQTAHNALLGPLSGSAIATFRSIDITDLPGLLYANQALSNLTSPTAINQDLLFGSDGSNNIGGNSGNRPSTAYILNNLLVGTSAYSTYLANFGVSPFSGYLLVGAISDSTPANKMAALIGAEDQATGGGFVGFMYNSAVNDSVGFSTPNVASDPDWQSLNFGGLNNENHYLRLGADGTFTFLSASAAGLLWAFDGTGGDIGSRDGGTTLKRPGSVFVKNKVFAPLFAYQDNTVADASAAQDVTSRAANKTAGTGNGGNYLAKGGDSVGGTGGDGVFAAGNATAGSGGGGNVHLASGSSVGSSAGSVFFDIGGSGSNFGWEINPNSGNNGNAFVIQGTVGSIGAGFGFDGQPTYIAIDGTSNIALAIWPNSTSPQSSNTIPWFLSLATNPSRTDASPNGTITSASHTFGQNMQLVSPLDALNDAALCSFTGTFNNITTPVMAFGAEGDLRFFTARNLTSFEPHIAFETDGSGSFGRGKPRASVTLQGINFHAMQAGSGGNALSVEFRNDAPPGPFTVFITQETNNIVVHIDSGSSTKEIVAGRLQYGSWPVFADFPAGGVVTTQSATPLTGGNNTPQAMRPASAFIKSFANIGNIPLLTTQADSYYNGYLGVGITNADAAGDVYAYMGSGSQAGATSPQIGFAHSALNAPTSDLFAFWEWLYPADADYMANGDVAWNTPGGRSLFLRENKNVELVNNLIQHVDGTGDLGSPNGGTTLQRFGQAWIKNAVHLGDNGAYDLTQGSAGTTTATVTTAQTIATLSDTTVFIKTRVVGKRVSGSSGAVGDTAVFELTATVKNIGGTVTVNAIQSDYVYQDQLTWGATLDVSGTNVRVRVNGDTGNNVSWTCTTETQRI